MDRKRSVSDASATEGSDPWLAAGGESRHSQSRLSLGQERVTRALNHVQHVI